MQEKQHQWSRPKIKKDMKGFNFQKMSQHELYIRFYRRLLLIAHSWGLQFSSSLIWLCFKVMDSQWETTPAMDSKEEQISKVHRHDLLPHFSCTNTSKMIQVNGKHCQVSRTFDFLNVNAFPPPPTSARSPIKHLLLVKTNGTFKGNVGGFSHFFCFFFLKSQSQGLQVTNSENTQAIQQL